MKRILAVFFWSIFLLSPMIYFLSRSKENSPLNPIVLAGRRVYENSGCPACHTRFLRKNVAEMARYTPDDYFKIDVTPAASQQRFNSNQLDMFTRRIGPDLEFPSDVWDDPVFLESYLKNPRRMYKHSIMPGYAHLFNEKLTADEILFASRSLKNKPDLGMYLRGQALISYLRETPKN